MTRTSVDLSTPSTSINWRWVSPPCTKNCSTPNDRTSSPSGCRTAESRSWLQAVCLAWCRGVERRGLGSDRADLAARSPAGWPYVRLARRRSYAVLVKTLLAIGAGIALVVLALLWLPDSARLYLFE
jgi:hypothetical protein